MKSLHAHIKDTKIEVVYGNVEYTQDVYFSIAYDMQVGGGGGGVKVYSV